jgi:hypothetical protein
MCGNGTKPFRLLDRSDVCRRIRFRQRRMTRHIADCTAIVLGMQGDMYRHDEGGKGEHSRQNHRRDYLHAIPPAHGPSLPVNPHNHPLLQLHLQ